MVAIAPSVAAGEVYYRWIDDRGHPVHSDRPPPRGVDYEVISTSQGLKRRVDADEGAVPLEVESTPGNEFEEVAKHTAKGIAKNPERCRRAQENLATLDSKDFIRLRDEQGELRLLTEEEKAKHRALAVENVEMHCD